MNIGKLTLDNKYLRINGWEKVAGIIPESYKQRYLALCEKSKDNKIENKTTVYSTPLYKAHTVPDTPGILLP